MTQRQEVFGYWWKELGPLSPRPLPIGQLNVPGFAWLDVIAVQDCLEVEHNDNGVSYVFTHRTLDNVILATEMVTALPGMTELSLD